MLTRIAAAVAALACGLAVALGGAPVASAHHSASSWGPYYRERYLACNDAPWDRVHCVGAVRALSPLRAALRAGIGGADRAAGAAHAAALDAVYFHVTSVVPELRAYLAPLPPPAPRGHPTMTTQGLRAEAAYALAHLGDTASAPAIGALVRDFETTGYGSLWEDTLAALAVLDPAAASAYALDLLGRQTDWRTSMPGGSSKLGVLAHVRATDAPAALPVLAAAAAREEHGYDHAYCELMAARVRVDPVARASVRKLFVGSYSGSWLAGCSNAVLAELGGEAADAPALIRHLGRADAGLDFGMTTLAYRRLVALIATGVPPATQAVIRKALVTRSGWPHVADPTSRTYQRHFVVYHQAALAGLGDAAATAALWAIVDDPADQTGAAWLGALAGLQLRLPDAVEHAAALFERGIAYTNSERAGIYANVRTAVLDAYVAAAPMDARWTMLLLDASAPPGGPTEAAERAHYLLSRLRPAGACVAVTGVAAAARPPAVEHALLALTALDQQCLPEFQALATDRAAPPAVRGAALELSAALYSPTLAADIAQARADHVAKPAVDRAMKFLRNGKAPALPARPTPPVAPAPSR